MRKIFASRLVSTCFNIEEIFSEITEPIHTYSYFSGTTAREIDVTVGRTKQGDKRLRVRYIKSDLLNANEMAKQQFQFTDVFKKTDNTKQHLSDPD